MQASNTVNDQVVEVVDLFRKEIEIVFLVIATFMKIWKNHDVESY